MRDNGGTCRRLDRARTNAYDAVLSEMNEPKRLKLESSAKPALTPILVDELNKDVPLIDVYVAKIKDPKTTSKIVTELNSVLPVLELAHLKRVRRREVLLLPKANTGTVDVLDVLKEKGFDVGLIEDVRIVSVAEAPPKIRRQHEVAQKSWPCNFHPNPYLERLATNTLFSDAELEQHAKFMKVAIDISEFCNGKESVVVVDPRVSSIVAFGFDQTEYYPTQHAVMVAIDAIARTQKGGVWKLHGDHSKIESFIKNKYPTVEFGFSRSEDGPYLCTGYSAYCVREPCITCAMALIHSRVRRVFYGVNSEKGGLGSLCKIHCVENLNHRYEVFAGLLRNECRAVIA